MLFNSIQYALFLPIVFIVHWLLGRTFKFQNKLLLTASYLFYSFWSYKFLFLLAFSTLIDFFSGLKIANSTTAKSKRFWLYLSIIINVSFLVIFKYYNFFVTSFSEALLLTGVKTNFILLEVILPVGISFYTFHGISYIIDIYKQRIKPETNFVNYALFVSFFPLLVAGPIERATHLLPQIRKKRNFDQVLATDGLRQILWGLFKKIAIADNCASFSNITFHQTSNLPGSTLALGAFFFAIQIYCDFSGYSDIAIGTAKLFGIDLLRNFSFPYFSRSIAEFWRRWHMSLSGWFKDYLYIPLGGSKVNARLKIRNIFIIFIISGFWHGANWTFIAWGIINAIYLLPSVLLNKNRKNLDTVANGRNLPKLTEIIRIFFTFILIQIAWVFFRAQNMAKALAYLKGIFSLSLFTIPKGRSFNDAGTNPGYILILITLMFIMEWNARNKQHALDNFNFTMPRGYRWLFYYSLILCIFYFSGSSQQFIYFQF